MQTLYAIESGRVPPTETALIEALRINDRRVQGVTRLDQQLVYVPFAAIGAAISFASANHERLHAASMPDEINLLKWIVIGGVFVGLVRNQWRHATLLAERRVLEKALGLPARSGQDWAWWAGRALYFVLFLAGFLFGSRLLVSVIT